MTAFGLFIVVLTTVTPITSIRTEEETTTLQRVNPFSGKRQPPGTSALVDIHRRAIQIRPDEQTKYFEVVTYDGRRNSLKEQQGNYLAIWIRTYTL